ncbi:hypothetical protein ACFCW2_01575 [Qipengyuania sp. DSG2-2]|uniref:hypothetical protein n=1 Tax=Qipengyuania sp. DGS2-2 TaxID=3349631 RepID=UPI0036D316CA
MTNVNWTGDNPVGNMRDYFAGIGNWMLCGAVLLTVGLRWNTGDLGVVALVCAVVAGAVTGKAGFMAMRRFKASAPNPDLGAMLAQFTGFFAFLAGGLFGIMFSAVLGSAIASVMG